MLIDYLLMLFSKNNLNISDTILKIETCKYSESLIFSSLADEKAYLNTDDGKKISDEVFVQTLEGIEEIILPKTE